MSDHSLVHFTQWPRPKLLGQCADRSTIGSLCCESAEEAKLLIPSLQDKITDDDLQDLLDSIMRLRVSE